jgi:hypothetical protein
MSLHLGTWRSAVSCAKRRPQCGHGTLRCIKRRGRSSKGQR